MCMQVLKRSLFKTEVSQRKLAKIFVELKNRKKVSLEVYTASFLPVDIVSCQLVIQNIFHFLQSLCRCESHPTFLHMKLSRSVKLLRTLPAKIRFCSLLNFKKLLGIISDFPENFD